MEQSGLGGNTGILIHVAANPILGTGGLLRSLSFAQQWVEGGGNVVYLTRRLPNILVRQIAMAGCAADSVDIRPTEPHFAASICQVAHDRKCEWIALDDSNEALIQQLIREKSSDQRVLVLGRETPGVDFCTNGSPSFALIRRKLTLEKSERSYDPNARHCLLDFSKFSCDEVYELLESVSHRFHETGVVFEVVSPFASVAIDELRRKNESCRENFVGHHNPDRIFQSLYKLKLVLSTDEASFYEAAYAGLPSVLLSNQQATCNLPQDVTSLPWAVDCRQSDWMERTGAVMQELFSKRTRLSTHARQMERLVDGFAASRLCRALNQHAESGGRVRSA
ncbi:MAG: hypothetical protein GY743_20915 [Planctomycetaceae bacterium]|nr:hypothetical protein [Planctomycetaceae bacterium]